MKSHCSGVTWSDGHFKLTFVFWRWGQGGKREDGMTSRGQLQGSRQEMMVAMEMEGSGWI